MKMSLPSPGTHPKFPRPSPGQRKGSNFYTVVKVRLYIQKLAFVMSGNNYMPWFSYIFCYLVKHNIKASFYDHDGLISCDPPSFPVIFFS